jgi:hypothetical protein
LAVSLRGLAALALTAGALMAAKPESHAQIISTPTISSIQTALGKKENLPALTKFQNYTIKGLNFSATATNNVVKLERKYWYLGSYFWEPISETTPTYASGSTLMANIGDASPGEYRITVKVGREASNFKSLLVVSNSVSLDKVDPATSKPGQTVLLKGNLFPQTGTMVVLTPPVAISAYQQTRYIAPTTKTNFEITFVVPEDIWDGNWTVHVTGWMSATNMKFLTLQNAIAPKYAVTFESFTCLDLTADGPGTDEMYASMITYYGSTDYFEPDNEGTDDVYEYVDTGMTIKNQKYLYTGYEPTMPWFLIGLGECDTWWWDIWGGVYWSNVIDRPLYPRSRSDIDTYFYYHVQKDPVLLSKVPSQIANWLKDHMHAQIESFGDECLGVKTVRFSTEEVYKARSLKGQPLKKVVDYWGDSSHYQAEVHLRKIN